MTLPEDPWDLQMCSLQTPAVGTMGTEATFVWAETVISLSPVFHFILSYFSLSLRRPNWLPVCLPLPFPEHLLVPQHTTLCSLENGLEILTEISIFIYKRREHLQPFLGSIYECGISVYWDILGMSFTF